MKIRLLAVGKPRDGDWIRLHDRYAERLTRFGVRYESAWIADEREPARVLRRLDGRGHVTALDPAGTMLDSPALAEMIERRATPLWTLVIGGPDGLHRSVLDRADSAWSLSALTFPHEMVRAIVAEQLYRAMSIRRGLPYHKC